MRNPKGDKEILAVKSMHAYTGYDTVSAFAGKGKAKDLKLLISNKESH